MLSRQLYNYFTSQYWQFCRILGIHSFVSSFPECTKRNLIADFLGKKKSFSLIVQIKNPLLGEPFAKRKRLFSPFRSPSQTGLSVVGLLGLADSVFQLL